MPDAARRAPVTWTTVLDDFAAALDRTARRLAADDWDGDPGATPSLRAPVAAPTAEERARGAALLARAAEQERALRTAQDGVGTELADAALRRHAARRYTA